MKCSRCGAEIEDDSLHCRFCGTEVQIVPDYNSLEELLTANVREEINMNMQPEQEQKQKQKPERKPSPAKQPPHKKKKNQKQKKMLLILGSLLFMLLIGFLFYQGSYNGMIQRGYNALADRKYHAAIRYFQSAAGKDYEKPDSYIGLSEVFIRQKDLSSAEDVFTTQMEHQENNPEIYRAAAEFYKKTEQVHKIPIMIDACKSDRVLSELSEYIVEAPDFSLREDTYEKPQKLGLSSEGNTVYYTLDDSEPAEKTGARYGMELELTEGDWTIRAIAVNEHGIPSLESKRSYTIEVPVSEPPMVSPSTGLYEEAMEITVQVKEGCTAYYAFDKTDDLTPENGEKYTAPIKMPEGNHIFSVILADNTTGKISGITVRNYDLKLSTETPSPEE